MFCSKHYGDVASTKAGDADIKMGPWVWGLISEKQELLWNFHVPFNLFFKNLF
jgi:hypothetical protein